MTKSMAPLRDVPRVLIVEDDYLACIDLEECMLDVGIDVVGTAHSAEQAIELARKHRPTLIVMDVRLHGERSGIDAAKEIYRELGIRCIMATAYDDPRLAEQLASARPLNWVHKPYQTQEIVALVLESHVQRVSLETTPA
jgi:DNA-binding NarL/FixJ family response regulator